MKSTVYTKIPHNFGLDAARHFLSKYEEDIHPKLNTTFILESINFMLKSNIYIFDNECFLQLQCTAMDTALGSTNAIPSMGFHEITLYENFEANYNVGIWPYFMNNEVEISRYSFKN